jgi:two-component system chemotaxis sensor kinase CheA
VENTPELINTFVSESQDLLDDAEARLSGLSESYEPEIVNTVFRIFHSIKGSAGCLNFKSVKEITHEAETLLAIYREKQIPPSQAEIDLLYQTCDYIRQLIVNIESFLTDEGFEKETLLIVNTIKESIRNIGKEIGVVGQEEANRAAPAANQGAGDLVTPEIVEKFFAESIDQLDECEILILGLEKEPGRQDLVSSIFRIIHSIKGNAGFLHFDKVEQVCVDLEMFLDGMRQNGAVVNRNIISYLLVQTDSLQQTLGAIARAPEHGSPAKGTAGDKKIGEILVEMGSITEADLKEVLAAPSGRTGELLVEKGKISGATLGRALKEQRSIRESIGFGAGLSRKDIRVSTEKLDKLFDLMGELITAQAMVLYHPEVRAIASEDFTRTRNYLEKITRELHEITLGVRMIPIDGLFNKMYRVVRDLSQKAGKNVRLHVSGGDAEMDRNVMEAIADPLIHLVRNAVDHGLEPAEERVKKNKESTGTVRLSARYVGSEIWISVADDGRGLQRDRIIAKAREKGLLEGDGTGLPDRKVWDFVFLPGFSTAETVTNISGRGVGMDVVNKNIQKLNGSVVINSRAGLGTEMILRIPLTMVVVDAVIIRAGKSLFAIAALEISEFLKPDLRLITEIEPGKYVLKLREEIIPLTRPERLFDGDGPTGNEGTGVAIVLRKDAKKLCILVDEIVGSQQIVVKSIADSIGRCRGLSGFSILANGDIALILDVKEMIDDCIN